MNKDKNRDKWIGLLRRNYYTTVAVVVVLLLTGALAAWGTWLKCLAFVQADAKTVYLCSALAIVMALVFMPLGVKWPFLGIVHRWIVKRDKEVMSRYVKAYRIRLCILLFPTIVCWGCLMISPSDSAFYLLVISIFPFLLIYPDASRISHELGEDGKNTDEGAQ
ncbi:MAG: hypothetical protein NC388_03115 [Clostridium sp.]|nr:hypothetical protein [Clostridium sp.]